MLKRSWCSHCCSEHATSAKRYAREVLIMWCLRSQSLLEGASLRQGVTGKTVNGQYTGKEPDPELQQQSKTAPERVAVSS